ncbi:MAG: RHS repeat domain-containing protein [Balneola sp.]
MRVLYKTLLMMMIGFLCAVNPARANNVAPTAVLTHNFSGSQVYNSEMVTFSAANSYDNDESGYSITYYWWWVKIGSGIYSPKKNSSSATTFTTCFDLDAPSQTTTPSGCIGTGGATSVTVRLRVRDDEFTNSSYKYKTLTITDRASRKYFIKDHLGSIRTTIDQNGAVIGYDDYYPFGLSMPTRSNNTSNPNDGYKFTGAELDTEANLGIYHMNARGMDPVTGRFLQLDPMQQFASPYVYAGNNPVSLTDPTGMSTECRDGEDEDDCRTRQASERREENEQKRWDELSSGLGWTVGPTGSTSGSKAIKNTTSQNRETGAKKQDCPDCDKKQHLDGKRNDLGFMGNSIKVSQLDSEIEKDLFENFWLGLGDIYLTDSEFNELKEAILNEGKITSSNDVNFSIFGLEFNFKRSVVSLYSSSKYDRAFGSLTVFTTSEGVPVAVHDYYDFDPKKFGERSDGAEIATRLVHYSAPRKAKPFYILYPISLR